MNKNFKIGSELVKTFEESVLNIQHQLPDRLRGGYIVLMPIQWHQYIIEYLCAVYGNMKVPDIKLIQTMRICNIELNIVTGFKPNELIFYHSTFIEYGIEPMHIAFHPEMIPE